MENIGSSHLPKGGYQYLVDMICLQSDTLPDWCRDTNVARLVFERAIENEVASLVAHRMADIVGWQDLPAAWRQIHDVTFWRISDYLEELDRIAAVFSVKDISLVALKNSGIARGIYPCPGCVPMGDVDVLVRKQDFLRAHRLLIEMGYLFEFRSPLEQAEIDVACRDGGAEYWKLLPGEKKIWLELQWRAVSGRWIRPDQEPSSTELIERSIPIPGTQVRLLSPEDNLLQVTLHTAKHSYVRAPGFRLHLDVVRIVQGQTIDWDIFLKRVQELKVKTAVYFSLAIPKELFGISIPEKVLKSIKPSRWKVFLISRWLQKVGIFNPNEKKFSKIGYIIFTSLLYDSLGGLLRGIFPDRKWMCERYRVKDRWHLPLLYLKRLSDLALRRINT